MRKSIQLLLALILFTQLGLNAQVVTNQYLSKVGVKDSLYSNTLKELRLFYVQLPADYNKNNLKKYPVIYILDGENLLPTVSNVHSFYSGGFMPEAILIGISNHKNRTRDLTTSVVKNLYNNKDKTGEAENFEKFIASELIPYIENKYPVTNYRTLIGHSYGGLFAINTLVNHASLFNNYIAIDPSLDWDNQKLITQAKSILASKNYKGKSLFMSLSGQLHMQNSKITIDNVMQDSSDFTLFPRSNIAFSNVVRKNAKNGLTFDWKFYPRDLHGTIPFPSIMDGLISVFKWYQMENTDKINSFDTSKEELLSIIKYREEKLQSHFGYSEPPYPEALLNMSGYMNMDMKQLAKAKMYFEQTLKYYPKSANAYDSMADYYEAQGDIPNATKYVIKANNLKSSDYYKKRIEGLKSKINNN